MQQNVNWGVKYKYITLYALATDSWQSIGTTVVSRCAIRWSIATSRAVGTGQARSTLSGVRGH